MLAEIVRNGRVEAVHRGVVAIVDGEGRLVASAGDVDLPFYARSALKPFQAVISQRFGADLAGETLALACASHAGLPEHLAIVEAMLESFGLSVADLRTPAAWPVSPRGHAATVVAGATGPSPLFHNCSGKHAGVLRACVASGFDLPSYRDPSHPVQQAVTTELEDRLGHALPIPGVDGCGLPAHVTSTRDLARLFAGLGSDEKLAPMASAMSEHPVLIGDVGRVDGLLAAAGMPAKSGAEGCLGVALPEHGFGVAVKSWDGSDRPLAAAMAAVLDHLGALTDDLASALHTDVLGGGEPVGGIRSLVELA